MALTKLEIKGNTFYAINQSTGVEWKLPKKHVRYEDNKDNSVTYYDSRKIKSSKNFKFDNLRDNSGDPFTNFQALTDWNDSNLGSGEIVDITTNITTVQSTSEMVDDGTYYLNQQNGNYQQAIYTVQGGTIYLKKSNFSYPEWYTGFKPVIKETSNSIETTFSIIDVFQTLIDTETPYYVATTEDGGSDSNDGLSVGNPKEKVSTLLTLGAKLIYMSEGNYHKSVFGVNYDVAGDDIAIIGVGKVRVCGYHNGQTWNETSAGSETYVTTQTNADTADGVIDFLNLDSDGYGTVLNQVTSEALCISTPNSWFVDTGLDRYLVHMSDGREVNNGIDMTANLTASFGFRSNSGRLLISNIEAVSDLSFASTNSTSTFKLYLLDYSIPYPKSYRIVDSGSKNGLTLNGVCTYSENLFMQNASADCINYTNALGVGKMDFMENNATIKNPNYNDKNAGGIYQCSTSHQDVEGVRILSNYDNGDKDTIKDVNTSKSIFIGCNISQDGSVVPANPKGLVSVVDGYMYKCTLTGSYEIEGTGTNGIVLTDNQIDTGATFTGETVINTL